MPILRHEIWIASPPSDHPALVHEFYGVTEREAFDAYAAHVEVDDALRACIDRGAIHGRRCTIRWSYLPSQGSQPSTSSASASASATPMQALSAAALAANAMEIAAPMIGVAGLPSRLRPVKSPATRSMQLEAMQKDRQAQVGGWKGRPTPQSPAATAAAQRAAQSALPGTTNVTGSNPRSNWAARAGFSPQVIEGGRGRASPVQSMAAKRVVAVGDETPRLPGHEHHDPDVCDVRTG